MDYNWNNVSFGTEEFNSSQNFFKRIHPLHERMTEEEIKKIEQQNVAKLVKANNKAESLKQQLKLNPVTEVQKSTTTNKENINLNNNNNKAILAVIEKPVEKKQPATSKALFRNVLKKTVSNNLIVPAVKEVKNKIEPVAVIKKITAPSVVSKAPIKSLVSKTQTVIKPNIKTLKSISLTSSCKQYEDAMMQKKKKEMIMKRLKDEEEKQVKYEFRAKPPPKFKKPPTSAPVKQAPVNAIKMIVKQKSMIHIQLKKKFTNDCIIPSCADPERLKKNAEHLRKLKEKYEPTNIPFRAQPCNILYKDPFVPKFNQTRTVIDSKPFQLKLTERLIQRSEFDRNLHVTIEKRKVQEEVRRQQQDLADRKVIRQKTEFRAKPNPFK